MKAPRLSFDQLQIDGFGHFHEFKLELGPGLNVLYGDNGVGKSTLMAFVRSVLFGFARRNTPERYQTHGGKAFGGRVLLSTPHGELWIQRLDGKKAEGELTVKNGVMAAVPESRLREALASVDRELFEQVFAFGLDELRSWGQLMDAGKVKDALAAASMQGALRLPQALEKFDAEARGLWGKQATTRPLNLALQELAQVRARRLQLGDRPAEYFATRAQLEATALDAERLSQALEAAARDEFLLERLQEAAPHVERAVEAAARLAALPPVAPFPEGGLARLDEALLAQQSAAAAHARAAAGAQNLERRLAQLTDALGQRPAPAPISAAVDGWRQVAATDAELDERRADWTRRELRLSEQVQRLGLSTPLAAIDASATARAGLTAVRTRCAEALERTARAEEALRLGTGRREDAQRQRAQLQAELDLVRGPAGDALEPALEAARGLPNLEHQARVVEAQLEDRQTALAAAAVPDEPAPLERWPVWLVAAVAGALLLLAGAAFAFAGFGAGVVALGFALALSALLITVHHQDHSHWLSARSAHQAVTRHRHEHRERLTGELEVARARLSSLQQQLHRLRSVAGVGPDDSGGARLAELERLAGAASRRAELGRDAALADARHQSALEDEAAARAALAAAAADHAAARAALEAQLARLGLPSGVEASGALELLAEAGLAQAAARTLADQSASLERDTHRVAQAAQALERAAQQAQVSGSTAAQLVAGLLGWLEAHGALQAEAAAISSRGEDAAAALCAAQADQAQAQARVDALLAAAQVVDLEAFRKAGAAFGAREALAAEAQAADARVKVASGLAVEAAHAQLLIAPGIEARGVAAREARLALEAQRREVHEQRGALAQKLTAWESDAQLGQLLQQEQMLTARAEQLARRFAVARLGQAVLGQAREKFEAEHQPQVVLRAGQLFKLLTGGKYPLLVLPANGALQTIDSQGRAFSVEQLSRGTREQLLTSLRLAMIEDFGRERLALPVMVDDVLVNFDPHRAERMVEALAELSTRHQVLAFTCHPQTRELFKAYGAKAIEVSTRAQLALLPS
ncbi:MAG: hypothetical protein H6Q89_1495 [Myxococcaceae bacterium]|nr:hypothetical protein [Myxococcaceae bacterium]